MRIYKFNESYNGFGWENINNKNNLDIKQIHENGLKIYVVNIFSNVTEIINIDSINNRNKSNHMVHDLFPYLFIIDDTKLETLKKVTKNVISLKELYDKEIQLRIDQVKGLMQ